MKEGVAGVPGDYAANIGTTGADYVLQAAYGIELPPNGAFQLMRGIRFSEMRDGLSHTFLVGEKHVPQNFMFQFPWDCGIYDGHNPVCNTRCAGPGFPLANQRNDLGWKFGSYHPGICQFVFCDGSVRSVANGVNEFALGLFANREDGQTIPVDY